MAQRDANRSATALRAFRVLEAVAQHGLPLSVTEISRKIGMDRATCYRMLRTIEQAGYLVRESGTKNYQLSRRVLSLAKPLLAEDEGRRLIAQALKRVSTLTSETCHFSELDGDSTVLTLRSKGTQLVAVDFQIGERSALHTTSVGKAILAFQAPDFIDDFLSRPLASSTPHTIVDARKLRGELAAIRTGGVAYDHYELALGMKCVAVPVRDARGEVRSGLSISGPDLRFTEEKLLELGRALASEAARLERAAAGEV